MHGKRGREGSWQDDGRYGQALRGDDGTRDLGGLPSSAQELSLVSVTVAEGG